jgi:hypothetical protein
MHFTRRQFLKATGAAGLTLATSSTFAFGNSASRIDRRTLVQRHNPTVTKLDPFSALTVGNGEFAFTADVTGLQTFTVQCEKDFPLCTMSHWGWHTIPAPAGIRREDFRYKDFDVYGRKVGYATSSTGQETLFNWLRENPHGLHLGRVAFELKKSDGSAATPDDLKNCRQVLDLWSGLLDSRFEFDGQPVHVQTCCHPELDAIAVRVESLLLANGQIKILFAFPYGSPKMITADWTKPERHTTKLNHRGEQRMDFERKLDDDFYFAGLKWSRGGAFTQKSAHEFLLGANSGNLEFICAFSPKPVAGNLPRFNRTQSASADHWEKFWSDGGAIDLSDSTDSRAEELERRIVLSLYNTAIHCAGSLPSQETGLLYNTWFGKFHLEMHWWHSVHFTAWGRFSLFEKSLGLYERILPLARETAARQGYRGARWPKMIGPDGHDSPSPIGPLLVWQQPHPIYYAELCYRQQPTKKTLERWCDIVFASAEFMASYAYFDGQRKQCVLGPPMKTVSENADTLTTINPTFELAYWRFGLRVAQAWRELLGLAREPKWDLVLKNLSPLPVQDGLYLMQENMPDTFTEWNWQHPALLGAFGMQPGDGADAETMRRTVRRVMEVWQWDRAWGWDFPMTALAAARVGEPGLAVDALLIDSVKNRYHPNGHNYQSENLTAYLPGNGGLLAATAMMAAGWTNGPSTSAPGFPNDGKWSVRHEDLKSWM